MNLDHSCVQRVCVSAFASGQWRSVARRVVREEPSCISNSTGEKSMREYGSLKKLLFNVVSKSFQGVITVAKKMSARCFERRRPKAREQFASQRAGDVPRGCTCGRVRRRRTVRSCFMSKLSEVMWRRRRRVWQACPRLGPRASRVSEAGLTPQRSLKAFARRRTSRGR